MMSSSKSARYCCASSKSANLMEAIIFTLFAVSQNRAQSVTYDRQRPVGGIMIYLSMELRHMSTGGDTARRAIVLTHRVDRRLERSVGLRRALRKLPRSGV